VTKIVNEDDTVPETVVNPLVKAKLTQYEWHKLTTMMIIHIKKLDINNLYRNVIVLYSYMFPNIATLCNLHFAFVLQA